MGQQPRKKLTTMVLISLALLSTAACLRVHVRISPRRFPLQESHCASGHVIFAIVRQETHFLLEWLDYHVWLGFDHFYIYNQDDDKATLAELLRNHTSAGLVSLTPWNVGEQATAYLHAIDSYSENALSWTFLDVDEFVVFPENLTVAQALSRRGLFSNKKCLELLWWSYGDAGADAKSVQEKGVLQVLTRRARTFENKHPGKVVVRGGRNGKVYIFKLLQKLRPIGGWWHTCKRFASTHERATLSAEHAFLAHFQFRYGNESFKMRLARGTRGVFKTQSIYSTAHMIDFAHRNEMFDDSLLKRSALVRANMEKNYTTKRPLVNKTCTLDASMHRRTS